MRALPSFDTPVPAEPMSIAIPATFVPMLMSIACPEAAAVPYVMSMQFPVWIPVKSISSRLPLDALVSHLARVDKESNPHVKFFSA